MKLSEQILLAAIAFFGMDASSTESEVHQKLHESAPLQDLIANATQETQKQLDTQNARVVELEAIVAKNAATIETSNARIKELESELATEKATVESLATQKATSDAKVAQLAGEVATLKAGKALEDGAAEQHKGAFFGGGKTTDAVIAVSEGALKNLLTKKPAV